MNWITFSAYIFAIGTILLIKAVWKNRNILKGFDLIGSFLTWLGMTFVLFQYIEWDDWLATCLTLITWLFWLLVTVFVAREKLRERKRNKIRRLEAEVESMLEAQYESQVEENENGS